MQQLDERLLALAALALDALRDQKQPVAADIGCDHGLLTAYLLEQRPDLTMIAGDVSAPSLEKARCALAACGMLSRVRLRVADGLDALDGQRVQAVVIAGMGASMILHIVSAGLDHLRDAVLIVQANTDLPELRQGLHTLGFTMEREIFCRAAGRHYVSLCARRTRTAVSDGLSVRQALLGAAADGVQDAQQRSYCLWQRGVRVREMEQAAMHLSERVALRMKKNSEELKYIEEALRMKSCTVADVVKMVGGIAPYELAEEWDNVGLLLGRAGAQVTRVLVALDLTQQALAEAKALGAQVILTHHPIMFSARRRVTDADREGALMLDMAQAGIAHIAAHTNLDSAPGGVNDTLMHLMGAQNVQGEGCMRVGVLAQGMTLGALAQRARTKLHGPVRVYGAVDTPVHKLGCCSGAGGTEIATAAAQGADCFITGEVRHHEALDACFAGCAVLEAGHYETENPVCEVLAKALQNAADAVEYELTVFCSKGNPFGRNE